MTFGTRHLVILFDLVQSNMLVSQGKVLSPGNEGSMAVTVYVYHLASILLDLCSYANFRASLLILVQFYVHAQRSCLRVHRETTGVLKGVVECQRETSNIFGSPQCGLFGFDLLYLGVGYCKGSGFV